MYENIELIVTIAFFVVAAIAIVGNIMKKNKNKDNDDNQ